MNWKKYEAGQSSSMGLQCRPNERDTEVKVNYKAYESSVHKRMRGSLEMLIIENLVMLGNSDANPRLSYV